MHEEDHQLTVVVTGGTGGIGLQTASTLAAHGNRLIVTGRDPDRGAAAVKQIRDAAGHDDVDLHLADLSVMAEVDSLAEKIAADRDHLDVLINNAGAINYADTVTPEGLELGFAVNVAAPWRLTHALRPQLAAAAAARVVNVTGGMPFTKLDVARLGDPTRAKGLSAYTNNKRALEALTLLLATQLRGDATINVVYPGGAKTSMTGGMTSDDFPAPLRLLWPLFRRRMQQDDGGASATAASRSSVYAATAPELAGRTGLYLNTASKVRRSHRSITDPAVQQQVAALVPSR